MSKMLRFPPGHMTMGRAIEIVKSGLKDQTISMAAKAEAIEIVAELETHNSITKDDLVSALRWVCSTYDLVESAND